MLVGNQKQLSLYLFLLIDRLLVHQELSLIRFEHAADHPQEGALARSVAAHQAKDLALPDLGGQMGYRLYFSKAFGNSLCLNHSLPPFFS